MEYSVKLQENPIFDYCKFILTIMVVAIHSNFLPEHLYPWLRLAVPLFFVMTGYFLFRKLAAASGTKEKSLVLRSFVKRFLKLYLFWFLVLLPFTLYIRKWFAHGFFYGFLYFLRSLLFSSTFRASWYLTASVQAALIVYCLSKRLSNKALLLLTGCIYLLVCIRSSYSFLYNNIPILKNSIRIYEKIFAPPYTSFPVALFWLVCGKCFAEGTFDVFAAWTFNVGRKIAAIAASAAALYMEYRIVVLRRGSVTQDCYMMLVPLVVIAFTCIQSMSCPPSKRAPVFRKASTIFYAMHATAASGISFLLKKCGLHRGEYVFIPTLLLCCIVCLVIRYLEKRKGFRWLRYSH